MVSPPPAHVGDSRAYLLRHGRLVQVSRDQTLLNSLIGAGGGVSRFGRRREREWGHDNVTVVVARFEGEGLWEATDEDELAYRNKIEPPAGARSWREGFGGSSGGDH